MASALAEAHITAEARLRRAVVGALEQIWHGLPGYDERNVDEWLSRALPSVLTGQRTSIALTDAYLASFRDRTPLGVDADAIIASARAGADPAEVYRRPFVTLWAALGNGSPFEDASSTALARATAAAAMDMQLAMRGTASAVQAADDGIYGYERVADGDACDFCAAIDGAYVKDADAFPLHNNCIIGSSAVSAPDAYAVTRRWYEGEVVVLQTTAGHELTVTPNHPILTDRGWVAAHLLREGDSVVSRRRFDGICGRVPDKEDVPTRIEDRFGANSVGALVSVPFAPEQFHGDWGDGEVDVVALDGSLDSGALASLLEPRKHLPLAFGVEPRSILPCRCGLRQRLRPRRTSSLGGVGRRRSRLTFGFGLSRRRDLILLGNSALRDSSISQLKIDHASGDAVALRERQHRFSSEVGLRNPADGLATMTRNPVRVERSQDRLDVEPNYRGGLLGGVAGEVELDSLCLVSGRNVAAHVFNLVTDRGWYLANGIVTHNCGCGLEPLTEPHPRAAFLPSGESVREHYAIREHGEVGPVLVGPADHFTHL